MTLHKALILVSMLFCTQTVSAQVKPKIMIIFDTSGSMLSNNKDGSSLCNNSGTSSRIYQLKVALFDALQGMGTQEVDFALSTFPQMVNPEMVPVCPSGHYYDALSQTSELDPNKSACKVSSHNPSTQQTANCKTGSCPWYADYKIEVLKVPFGNPIEDILYYFDQKEDLDAIAPLDNPEVRAKSGDSPWYTPLGKSLFYAYGYFDKEVVLNSGDYRKACERLAIALFTDGEETCNTSTSSAFHMYKWAENLYQNLGVAVHTVAIDLNSSTLQQIATKGHGTYATVVGNNTALKQAFLNIVANSLPPSETCNGLDDDCDSFIDEDFPLKGTACDNGKLGACLRFGIYICNNDGSGVTCDAQNAQGTPEICNGIDDDCNGVIDDNIPGGCIPCFPQSEICNGLDDNCNGLIDENIPQLPCGTTVGKCTPGVTKCVLGSLICDGAVGPSAEICDNEDNDCDNIIDGIMEICYSYEKGCDLQTGTCLGICAFGTRTCIAGFWGSCKGDIGPQTEICNGIDDNCDGAIDETSECPDGSKCINGECARPCSSGEFICAKGQICKDGWCIMDPCDPYECEKNGWVCKAGECVDLCKNVTCGLYETCVKGQCIDLSCYSKGCPTGERCIQGVCQTDPCAGVNCSNEEFCHNGVCTSLCDRITCPLGQICQLTDLGDQKITHCVEDPCANNQCTNDPCASVTCEKGKACDNGICVVDLCERTRCPFGYRCEKGNCVLASNKTIEVLATGSGGFVCSLNNNTQAPPWLLLICLILWGTFKSNKRRND